MSAAASIKDTKGNICGEEEKLQKEEAVQGAVGIVNSQDWEQ